MPTLEENIPLSYNGKPTTDNIGITIERDKRSM